MEEEVTPSPSEVSLGAMSQEELDKLWGRHPKGEVLVPAAALAATVAALEEAQGKLDRVAKWATETNPPAYPGVNETPVAKGPGDKLRGYNIARHAVAAILDEGGTPE